MKTEQTPRLYSSVKDLMERTEKESSKGEGAHTPTYPFLCQELEETAAERDRLRELINTIGVRCDEILTWFTIDDSARKTLTEISNQCDLAWGNKPQRKAEGRSNE